MAKKNENIHLFIVEEAYTRCRAKQTFSTTESSLEYIFGKKITL